MSFRIRYFTGIRTMKTISWDKYTNTAFLRKSPIFDNAIKFNKQFLVDTNQSQIEHTYAYESTNI